MHSAAKNLQHILCIDDESDILEVTRLCLETVGGYRVTSCSSGRQGIEQAKRDIPDLVIIDVMMPDADGPSVLKLFRETSELNHIPVIFMTARIRDAEVSEYVDQGAAAVLAKPFDPMKLSEQVESVWRKLNG